MVLPSMKSNHPSSQPSPLKGEGVLTALPELTVESLFYWAIWENGFSTLKSDEADGFHHSHLLFVFGPGRLGGKRPARCFDDHAVFDHDGRDAGDFDRPFRLSGVDADHRGRRGDDQPAHASRNDGSVK